MKNAETDRVFTDWAAELEKRFLDRSWRVSRDLDTYTLRYNMRGYDKTFKSLSDVCKLPDCQFPLRQDGGRERLPVIGDVCNLCYFMYHLLSSKAYWVGMRDDPRRDGR